MKITLVYPDEGLYPPAELKKIEKERESYKYICLIFSLFHIYIVIKHEITPPPTPLL